MRDATIERLSKIISDTPDSRGDNGLRRQLPRVHLSLSEGWFSLFLLAVVVYSTTGSVQAAGWVEHLNVLSLTTAFGLLGGLLAAKQRKLPRMVTHLVAIVFGVLFAFWQTAGAFTHGNIPALAQGMRHWFDTVIIGGVGDDDSIFLFFILALGFILAYMSAWLLYRTRSPWLLIVANAVVLLINLSPPTGQSEGSYIVFLVIFLMASLLLLLRFNLYESVLRWKRQGLRYSDDVGWEVMQAGALISIGILILSWILPWGYLDPTASMIWNADANPWVQVQNTWNRVISISGGTNPANHGNFRDALTLGGNPNLNHDLVFKVQTDDSGGQYLTLVSYDTYDKQGWSIGHTDKLPVKANQLFPSQAFDTHPVKQTISVVNPPGVQYPYLAGISDITITNVPASVVWSSASGTPMAWLGQNGYLVAGSQYTVTSSVSSADEKTLRSVPMPKDAPQYEPGFDGTFPPTYFAPTILAANTQLPSNLDPQIKALATRITAGAPTMYDKVVALETFLRRNYTYSVDIRRPPDEDGVSWFLFRSGNKGFCNYFASSMAVMARTLGIPARVVTGYTNGTYDAKTRQHNIFGTDAHAWTQVYFAGYGWINFEPSASFANFTRPLPDQFTGSGSSSTGANSGAGAIPPAFRGKDTTGLDPSDGGSSSGLTDAQAQQRLRQQLGAAFGTIILLILFGCIFFGIWWNRLFRRYGLATQLYGRICILANWAGIKLEPSRTPYECVQELALSTPRDAAVLERLGDIYVRDRWANPESGDHPRRNGDLKELPGMWKKLQPRLFLYVLQHPHFLRWLPERVWEFITISWQRRKARKIANEDL